MSNLYYSPTGTPAQRAKTNSSQLRGEFAAVEQGFDKLPAPQGGSARGFQGGSFKDPIIEKNDGSGRIDGLDIGLVVPAKGKFTQIQVTADASASDRVPPLSQVNALIAAHAGAADPHPTYTTAAELAAALATAVTSCALTWASNTSALPNESLLGSNPTFGIVIGGGATGTVTVERNQGSAWSSGTFTADKDGWYRVDLEALVLNSGNVNRYPVFYPYINSAYLTSRRRIRPAGYAISVLYGNVGVNWDLYLTAGQTLQIRAWDANGGNSQLTSGFMTIKYDGP